MNEERYKQLEAEYGDMLDGPDTPERREFQIERMKRKYEELKKQRSEE